MTQSLAEWHINKRCTHEFFQAVEVAGGLSLPPEWRSYFQTSLINIAKATAMISPIDRASFSRDMLEFEKYILESFLIETFEAAGGIPRGSWGANDKLDGPFYRFVRVAYAAVPLRLRPKTPDALCRRCRTQLRRIRQWYADRAKEGNHDTQSVS